ncbi:MAG: glycogen/starch synthase, partial [Desulfosarcinaceae bacterium]
MHVAVENDALPGAKVGGLADVIRDVAPALARGGCQVTTLVPSHGYLHHLPGAVEVGRIQFAFRGGMHTAGLFEIPAGPQHKRMRSCVLHHPWMEAFDPGLGRHRIYVNDGSDQPFFTDSNRFACFSAAAAAAAAQGHLGRLDVLHLHDWHTALIALLRRSDPACSPL